MGQSNIIEQVSEKLFSHIKNCKTRQSQR